jgi:excisionase family DNA binding protein
MKTERNTDSEQILLRGGEVAELLGISRAKAYRLMQHREIPVVTFGKSIRVPREALLEFLRARTQQPAGGVRQLSVVSEASAQ